MAKRWRNGRSVGRTIYRMVGSEASKDDVLIGVMDTPGLAARIVAAVNIETRNAALRIAVRELRDRWQGMPGRSEDADTLDVLLDGDLDA